MKLSELIPSFISHLEEGLADVQSLKVLSADATDYVEAFKKEETTRGLVVVVGLENSQLVSSDPIQLRNSLVVGVFERRGVNKLGPSALDLAIKLAEYLGQDDPCGQPDYMLKDQAIDAGERNDSSVNTFYLSAEAMTLEA